MGLQANYPLTSDSSALIIYSLGIAVWSTAFLEVHKQAFNILPMRAAIYNPFHMSTPCLSMTHDA